MLHCCYCLSLLEGYLHGMFAAPDVATAFRCRQTNNGSLAGRCGSVSNLFTTGSRSPTLGDFLADRARGNCDQLQRLQRQQSQKQQLQVQQLQRQALQARQPQQRRSQTQSLRKKRIWLLVCCFLTNKRENCSTLLPLLCCDELCSLAAAAANPFLLQQVIESCKCSEGSGSSSFCLSSVGCCNSELLRRCIRLIAHHALPKDDIVRFCALALRDSYALLL